MHFHRRTAHSAIAWMLVTLWIAPPNVAFTVRAAASHRDGGLLKEAAPTGAALDRLIEQVKKGDRPSVHAAFDFLDGLDGGDLEDLNRAFGELAGKLPKLFLEEVKEHRLSAYQVEHAVTMLPEKTVDDLGVKRRILRARISALASVKLTHLVAPRDQALAALRAYLASLDGLK